MNRKEKLVVFIFLIVLTVFVLFLTALYSIPLMLLLLLGLVAAISVLNRRKPELFDFLRRQQKNGMDLSPTPPKPISHPNEHRVYLMLVGINTTGTDTIVMDNSTYTIGRSKYCNGSLNDPSVSKRHLTLEYDEGEKLCYVTDENSSNGTFVNGVRLQPNQRKSLHAEDVLQIAFTAYTVEYVHY